MGSVSRYYHCHNIMGFLVVSALFLGLSLTLALPGMLPAEAAEKINRSDLTEDRIIFTSMVLAFSLTMAPVVMLYPLSDPNDYDYDYGRADISIIAEFKYIAVTCAAKSTGDLKTRVAAAFDTCQPLSTWTVSRRSSAGPTTPTLPTTWQPCPRSCLRP